MVYPDGAEFSGIWENGVHKEFRLDTKSDLLVILQVIAESQEILHQQQQQ